MFDNRDYNDDSDGTWIVWLILCAMFLALGIVIGRVLLWL